MECVVDKNMGFKQEDIMCIIVLYFIRRYHLKTIYL